MVSLGSEDNFDDDQWAKDIIAMDSKTLAVGSPSGLVKIFNRKDLSGEKVILRFSIVIILI